MLLFTDLCLLFDQLAKNTRRSQTRCKSSVSSSRASSDSDSPLATFKRWLAAIEHPSDLDALPVFKLVFPEHDIHRRYGLKETMLARELPAALGFHPPPELLSWNALPGQEAHGCFGAALHTVLTARHAHPSASTSTPLSIAHLDNLLDELASHCEFSAQTIKDKHFGRPRRRRAAILYDLFHSLNPAQSAYLAQIILRDLSPLIYPIPSYNAERALADWNASSCPSLELASALAAWNWALPTIYRYRADLDAAFHTLQEHNVGRNHYNQQERYDLLRKLSRPTIGHRLEIPKAQKGRSITEVARIVQRAGICHAEIKYDGERMQIHVSLDGPDPIKIFSKSKRDSTIDRLATHAIIIAALGLPFTSFPGVPVPTHLLQRLSTSKRPTYRKRRSWPRNVILEAEMVAYDEDADTIDEFANLHLCTSAVDRPQNPPQCTGMLDSSQTCSNSTQPYRHLALVFFDVLMVDEESLVLEPYSVRRSALEDIVHEIQGYSMLAERTKLDLQGCTEEIAIDSIISVFARCIVNREEGLMIKADQSIYNDYRPDHKWIKLKRDYIAGIGDSCSVCIIGAVWDKERGRELRVGSNCHTTFFCGLRQGSDDPQGNVRQRATYRVLFTVSYLPDRQSLVRANALVQLMGGVTLDQWHGRIRRNWDFDLEFQPGLANPQMLVLAQPLVFELYGAGFTRSRGSPLYELRFPRVSAIHTNRELHETVTLAEMQRMGKAASSWQDSQLMSEIDDLWASSTSGSASASEGNDDEVAESWRSRETRTWIRKLRKASRRNIKRKRDREPSEASRSPSKHRVLTAAAANADKSCIQEDSIQPDRLSPLFPLPEVLVSPLRGSLPSADLSTITSSTLLLTDTGGRPDFVYATYPTRNWLSTAGLPRAGRLHSWQTLLRTALLEVTSVDAPKLYIILASTRMLQRARRNIAAEVGHIAKKQRARKQSFSSIVLCDVSRLRDRGILSISRLHDFQPGDLSPLQ